MKTNGLLARDVVRVILIVVRAGFPSRVFATAFPRTAKYQHFAALSTDSEYYFLDLLCKDEKYPQSSKEHAGESAVFLSADWTAPARRFRSL